MIEPSSQPLNFCGLATKRVSTSGLKVGSCVNVPQRLVLACAAAHWFCWLVAVDAACCATASSFATRSSIDIDTVELRSNVHVHELAESTAPQPCDNIMSAQCRDVKTRMTAGKTNGLKTHRGFREY